MCNQKSTFMSFIEQYRRLESKKIKASSSIPERSIPFHKMKVEEETKKRRMLTIEVPVDIKKRIKALIDEYIKSFDEYNGLCDNDSFLKVPELLKHHMRNCNSFKIAQFKSSSTIIYSTRNIDEENKKLADMFIGSIIKFEDSYIYVTSEDVFIQNHVGIDDCGFGFSVNDFNDTPTAKIKSNSYMMKNEYYELSIYCGFYEILVSGCLIYNCCKNQTARANLGSSLFQWDQGEIKNENILVSRREEISFIFIKGKHLTLAFVFRKLTKNVDSGIIGIGRYSHILWPSLRM